MSVISSDTPRQFARHEEDGGRYVSDAFSVRAAYAPSERAPAGAKIPMTSGRCNLGERRVECKEERKSSAN